MMSVGDDLDIDLRKVKK